MSIKIAVLSIAMALYGCQSETTFTIDDTGMMNDLRSGQATLDCQIACAGALGNNLMYLAQVDGKSDWHDLAITVIEIGYDNDLEYYYLGHAAEGLGFYTAALKYYRISQAEATGSDSGLRCDGGGFTNLCNNIVFPRDLYPRIQAVQYDLAKQRTGT